jgi:hypothetical protein
MRVVVLDAAFTLVIEVRMSLEIGFLKLSEQGASTPFNRRVFALSKFKIDLLRSLPRCGNGESWVLPDGLAS